MTAGAFLFAGFLVGERTKIYTDFDTTLIVIAGGLWAFLGGLTVVARFRQWRLRRMLARSTAV
jgi:cytochrome c biogenesis protein CcdA